jgi:hypothetical protein
MLILWRSNVEAALHSLKGKLFKKGGEAMRRKLGALAVLALIGTSPVSRAADICTTTNTTDNLKYVQYFLSRVQDVPGCAMRVVDGHVVVEGSITNPAMSCPDMFAWKLFSEAVAAQFWRNWAADQETWPGNGVAGDSGIPYPLCGPSQPAGACCNPGSANNPGYDDPVYKAKHCPYFPGDHLTAADSMPVRIGVLPSKAHTLGLAANSSFHAALTNEATLAQQILEAPDPTKGRRVRQSMAEVVFRNKSFFDYVFRNNLYNTEGIVGVFKTNANNIAGPQRASGAPYRVADAPGKLSEIAFPADAVMVKSDWINRERAEQMGLRDDPKNPYIKMNITSPVLDDNGTILQPGEHWLIAILMNPPIFA